MVLVGVVLSPVAKGVWKDNPIVAVIVSWFLVQVLFFSKVLAR